ncbi:cysteine peptidase family C39 domain-containing protein [Armatimonas sp.]|uniref:cysteine peptidase family C39 domain-containing protein n=1 Tax=Armatimonas sp. TaxID=1872638 RepID=UPI0037515E2B
MRRYCCSFLVFVSVIALISGCHPPAPSVARAQGTIPLRGTTVSVRSLPEYQKAAALFAKGDKISAKLALEALLKRPNLSPTDTAFLKTQVGLCVGLPPRPRPAGEKEIGSRGVSGDCGPRALVLAAAELGVKADIATLAKAAGVSAEGTSLEGLVAAARSIGLVAQGVQVDRDALRQLPTPLVAWWQGNHFVAVLKISQNAFTGEVSVVIHDPNRPKAESIELADLLAKSGGIVLTLKK